MTMLPATFQPACVPSSWPDLRHSLVAPELSCHAILLCSHRFALDALELGRTDMAHEWSVEQSSD